MRIVAKKGDPQKGGSQVVRIVAKKGDPQKRGIPSYAYREKRGIPKRGFQNIPLVLDLIALGLTVMSHYRG